MPDIITHKGDEFYTGLLMQKPGFVSAMPLFETSQFPIMAPAEIEAIARSGEADGRKLFDPSFVTDQKSHGSCNGFAGAAALTMSRVRRGLPRVDLSGAYLYSLINGGSDNGSLLEDGMKALVSTGCATAATVGWDAIYPKRYDKAKADAEAAQNKAAECYAVGTQAGFWTALCLRFDVVVAVDVTNAFMHLDANGFPGGGNGPGNHAIKSNGIVWVNGAPAATTLNNWGLSYGMNGGMNLSWDRHFRTTFPNHVFYAIRTTTDGDGDGPPSV